MRTTISRCVCCEAPLFKKEKTIDVEWMAKYTALAMRYTFSLAEKVETQNMTACLDGWSSPTKENISTRFFISPVPSQSELLHADQAGAGACIVNAGLWSNFLR